MKDFVSKGTGNSRYLKSVSDFATRYPTYQDFVAALVAGTLPIDFNGINPDGITQTGTPLNKATLLTDATASKLGLGTDPTVDDALSGVEQTLTTTVTTTWTEDSTNGGYTQTVTVSGILATDNPIVDIVLGADITANEGLLEAWGMVTRIVTADGSITLYCNSDYPTVAMTIQLKVVR